MGKLTHDFFFFFLNVEISIHNQQVSSTKLLQSYKGLKLLYNVNSVHVFLLLCSKANLLYQLGQHNSADETLNMQCRITSSGQEIMNVQNIVQYHTIQYRLI